MLFKGAASFGVAPFYFLGDYYGILDYGCFIFGRFNFVLALIWRQHDLCLSLNCFYIFSLLNVSYAALPKIKVWTWSLNGLSSSVT